MGLFINVGNAGFQSCRNSEYVDKSGLIGLVNQTFNTERRYSCVAEYADRLLLVGINYDRQTKQHTCRIEPL